MSEHDNDSVSQFFQNALRRPKIRFREDDWKKMEAMLDQSPPITPTKKRRKGGAAIALVGLLLVSGTILFVSVGDDSSLSNEAKSTPGEIKSEVKSEIKGRNGERPGSDSRKQADQPSNSFTAVTASNSRSQQLAFATPGIGTSQYLNNDQFVKETKETIETIVQEKTDSIPDKPVIDDAVKGDTTVAPSDSIISEKKTIAPSRWSIMLAVSPDFTSPGMHKFTHPGRTAAIQVYYHLNDVISVSAGVVVDKSNYWDTGANYKTVDENFWTKRTNGMVADKAIGSCTMLEIPLGVRYNVYHSERTNVYAAVQASTYFMFDEYYHYVFKSPNPGAMSEWRAQRPSYSLFGVANLAVGFERAISKRMMVGISPYVNIPLRNMGTWSNMKLYSVGTAFTLRYKFQRQGT